MTVRTWTVVAAAVVLGVGMLTAGRSGAADDDKEIRAAIVKMADALEKGNVAGAKKIAESLKDAELEDIMNLMLPRKPGGKGGGLGVGDKPGAIMPDGIEKKVQELEKKAPPADEAAALERAGYIMQAISLAAENKVPKGKKGPWKKYNTDFDKALKDFTAAAKKKDPKAIQSTAIKLNNSCTACHNDFK